MLGLRLPYSIVLGVLTVSAFSIFCGGPGVHVLAARWLGGGVSPREEAAGASQAGASTVDSSPTDSNPDARCASCHAAIYAKYEQTPMAQASGAAANGLIDANLKQSTTQVEYRIRKQGDLVVLSFERPSVESGGVLLPELKGSRTLRYFIGSGLRGRTYLFETNNYWFETPINWYARKKVWDMAPNFLHASEMPLTLPVDPGCLRCHATGAQPSMPEARNRYAEAPFLQGGITCDGCHGDPTAHLASDGKAPMMEIEELPAERRDSICLSCHLEGQAAIVHEGKKLENFRPGDSLWEYASFYVHTDEQGSGGRATSQWEALLTSACKRGSGDRLTCTTCHDPHGSDTLMTSQERVNWYRARCLSCHETPAGAQNQAFSAAHYPNHPDCTACHMQRASSTDIAHEQVTDHRIVTHFEGKVIPPSRTGPLVEVGPKTIETPQPDRNLGLAYAQFAALGDRQAYDRALSILKEAEVEPAAVGDVRLHSQLGFLEQVAGEDQQAAREYQKALSMDPHEGFSEGNLGLILARHGEPGKAVRLWTAALADDPAAATTGINLATVDCGLGYREDALAALDRVLEFAPDDRAAAALQVAIRDGERPCGK